MSRKQEVNAAKKARGGKRVQAQEEQKNQGFETIYRPDEIDQRLLLELYKDGKGSYTAIGKRLFVVEGTVRKRIKQLIKNGITHIVGIPNMRKLGYGFMAVVGIQAQMAQLRTVADQLAQQSGICSLAFVTGRYDLLAIVMARSSKEFSQIMEKSISLVPGVLRTETFVVLDIIKGGWPTPELDDILRDMNVAPTSKT